MAEDIYYKSFDGSQSNSITRDHTSYTLYSYNSKKVDTAAVRCVRYLALTEPEKYSFDIDAIGIMGNSKGGMFMFMGADELRNYTVVAEGQTLAEAIDDRINAYAPSRMFVGHHGESRYQNGLINDYTIDGYTIRGGKLQPWTTYVDENGVEREILAYTNYIYAANGGNVSDMYPDHTPIFTSMSLDDPYGNGYSSANQMANAARTMDVPCMYFVCNIGHTFAYGNDVYHNVDTYDALFDFSGYYLADQAIKVVYTDPSISRFGIDPTTPIVIKFNGSVDESEIEKIKLTDTNGNEYEIIAESAYGGTEWTLIHEVLPSGTVCTLTIPAGFKGDNGVAMTDAFIATYTTEAVVVDGVSLVSASNGTYATVPYASMAGRSYGKLSIFVGNDATNTLGVYAVTDFNTANPEASVIGKKISSVNVYGTGYYDVDLTDAIGAIAENESATFFIKPEREVGVTESGELNLKNSIAGLGNGTYTIAVLGTVPDGKYSPATMVQLTTNVSQDGKPQYINSEYYPSFQQIISTTALLGGSKLTEDDLGRKFTVTLRVYDTVSRTLNFRTNNATSANTEVLDFDYIYFSACTTANEWTEITFDYVVKDPIYGPTGLYTKRLSVYLSTTGDTSAPLYIESISSTETVTDVEILQAVVIRGNYDGFEYKAPTSGEPFSVGSNSYDTLGAAVAACRSGDVITLNKNYVLGSDEALVGIEKFESLTLDLQGYKLYISGSNNFIDAKATSATVATTGVTVKNGAIYIDNTALVGYGGSTVAGNGKAFNIVFDNVTISASKNAMASNLLSETSSTSTANIKVAIVLDDCTVKLNMASVARMPMTLCPSGEAGLDIDYTFVGGSIQLDSMIRLTLWNDHKDVLVTKRDAEYTTIEIPEMSAVPEILVKRDDAVCYFKQTATENNTAIYTTVINENFTPYGIIPSEFANAEKYPYVAFDGDENFVGAYEMFLGNNGFGGPLEGARGYMQNNAYDGTKYADDAVTVFILARRDYVIADDEYFNNIAQFQGVVTLDLDGYTISQGKNKNAVLNGATKGWGSAAGTKVFPSTLRVMNGKFLVTNTGVIRMNTWDSVGDGSIAYKYFNFIFDNVTFGFNEGATTAKLITYYENPSSTSVAAPFSVVLNDCTFDYKTTPPSKAATIFDTNTTGKYIDVDIQVNGGKILGGSMEGITILNMVDSYTSSVTFGKGTDGSYTALEVNSGVEVSAGNYPISTDESYGYYLASSAGGTDVYTLQEKPVATEVVTKYGTIPLEYADAEEYPFVVFDNTGKFWGGFSTWLGDSSKQTCALQKIAYSVLNKNAWNSATGTYTNNGGAAKSAVVLMRRDYSMTTADAKFDNMGHIQGRVTIDLGGFTLSQGTATQQMFQCRTKNWGSAAGEKVFPTWIDVINGTLLTTTKTLCFAHTSYGDESIKDKVFELNFNGVTIGVDAGATVKSLMVACGMYDTDVAGPININFNDCIFDFVTNVPANDFTVLNNYPGSNLCQVMISINGGEFLVGTNTKITFSKTNNAHGSYNIFGKGSDGMYPLLKFTGTTVTTQSLPTAEGNMKFVKVEDGVYTLGSVANPYGSDIPQNYAYAEKYPFIVLKPDGSFLAAYEMLYGENKGSTAALPQITYNHLSGNGWNEETQSWSKATDHVIILMRRDYTLGTTEYFDNWGHVQGTVIFDLQGYTLTQPSGAKNYSLFSLKSKGWSGAAGDKIFPTTINVKNGNINMYSTSAVGLSCYDSVGGGAIAGKKFTVSFDGVRFGLTKGATLTNLILGTSDASTKTGTAPFAVSFNDCIYDLATNYNNKTIKLFNNSASSAKYLRCDLKINGGMVIAPSLKAVTLVYLDTTSGSTTTFGKTDSYLSLVLPIGTGAPTDNYNGDVGALAFIKTAQDAETVTYQLGKAAIISIVPKVSVTLDAGFVYNVYLPADVGVASATINGADVNITACEKVMLDGTDYYKLTVKLGASNAASELKLRVVVTTDGTSAAGTWTLSIPKYTKKVLDSEDSTAVEKTLMKDMLAYIKAAYIYFAAADVAEVTALVDSIIGDYTREFVKKEADFNTGEGISGVTFVLSATPKIRFYLANGYNADMFTFKSAGAAISVTAGVEESGSFAGYAYVDVSTYAYRMCETLSYYINGEFAGSYHLNSYYEFVSGNDYTDADKAAIVDLIEKFYNYCASAQAYRDQQL